jgi:hypothetical protein
MNQLRAGGTSAANAAPVVQRSRSERNNNLLLDPAVRSR